MKQIHYILSTLLLLVACQGEQVSVSPEEQQRRDSLALHVAVMPVVDCLPIYYAHRTGMFESEGLDVRLNEYLSLMDCDTALTNKHSEVAYADILRLLRNDSDACAIASMPGRQILVTAKTKRIRQLKHLRERMVALERLSTGDYWSDQLMTEAGLQQADIYRPQINDIRLRKTMLTEQLVDAAMLPEPYATEAIMGGNKTIASSMDCDTIHTFNCLAALHTTTKDTLRRKQIKQFLNIYDKAVVLLNEGRAQNDSVTRILQQNYALSQVIIDTLRLPHFPSIRPVKKSDIDEASRWLRTRERTPKQGKIEALTKYDR